MDRVFTAGIVGQLIVVFPDGLGCKVHSTPDLATSPQF